MVEASAAAAQKVRTHKQRTEKIPFFLGVVRASVLEVFSRMVKVYCAITHISVAVYIRFRTRRSTVNPEIASPETTTSNSHQMRRDYVIRQPRETVDSRWRVPFRAPRSRYGCVDAHESKIMGKPREINHVSISLGRRRRRCWRIEISALPFIRSSTST